MTREVLKMVAALEQYAPSAENSVQSPLPSGVARAPDSAINLVAEKSRLRSTENSARVDFLAVNQSASRITSTSDKLAPQNTSSVKPSADIISGMKELQSSQQLENAEKELVAILGTNSGKFSQSQTEKLIALAAGEKNNSNADQLFKAALANGLEHGVISPAAATAVLNVLPATQRADFLKNIAEDVTTGSLPVVVSALNNHAISFSDRVDIGVRLANSAGAQNTVGAAEAREATRALLNETNSALQNQPTSDKTALTSLVEQKNAVFAANLLVGDHTELERAKEILSNPKSEEVDKLAAAKSLNGYVSRGLLSPEEGAQILRQVELATSSRNFKITLDEMENNLVAKDRIADFTKMVQSTAKAEDKLNAFNKANEMGMEKLTPAQEIALVKAYDEIKNTESSAAKNYLRNVAEVGGAESLAKLGEIQTRLINRNDLYQEFDQLLEARSVIASRLGPEVKSQLAEESWKSVLNKANVTQGQGQFNFEDAILSLDKADIRSLKYAHEVMEKYPSYAYMCLPILANSGDPKSVEYAAKTFIDNPALLTEDFAARAALNGLIVAGRKEIVPILLENFNTLSSMNQSLAVRATAALDPSKLDQLAIIVKNSKVENELDLLANIDEKRRALSGPRPSEKIEKGEIDANVFLQGKNELNDKRVIAALFEGSLSESRRELDFVLDTPEKRAQFAARITDLAKQETDTTFREQLTEFSSALKRAELMDIRRPMRFRADQLVDIINNRTHGIEAAGDRKVAVVAIAESDNSGVMTRAMSQLDALKAQGYFVIAYEVNKDFGKGQSFEQAVKDGTYNSKTRTNREVDAIIIFAHGARTGLAFGTDDPRGGNFKDTPQQLSISDAAELRRMQLSKYLKDDGALVLVSCSVGYTDPALQKTQDNAPTNLISATASALSQDQVVVATNEPLPSNFKLAFDENKKIVGFAGSSVKTTPQKGTLKSK